MVQGNSCRYFGSVYSNSCLSKDKKRQVLKALDPRAGKEAPREFNSSLRKEVSSLCWLRVWSPTPRFNS